LLREVKSHARDVDLNRLRQHGKVYAAIEGASVDRSAAGKSSDSSASTSECGSVTPGEAAASVDPIKDSRSGGTFRHRKYPEAK